MDMLTNFFWGIITFFMIFVGSIFFVIIFGILLYRVFLRLRYNKLLKKNLESRERLVLEVKISENNERKEEGMVAFLRSLHRFLSSGTVISLEIVSSKQFLSYYIVTTRNKRQIIESQFYAQFPDAEIMEVKDYLSQWKENTEYAELSYKQHSMAALKSYENSDEDILKNLSALLAKSDMQDEVAIQLVMERIGAKSMKQGFFALYYKILNSSNESKATQKLSQHLFLGKLRIAYTSRTKREARMKLHTFLPIFKSVKSSSNELVKKSSFFPIVLAKAFAARIFEQGDLWSIPEIVTLYHFPTKENTFSNVVRAHSKRAAPPDILPREGQYRPGQIALIGETNYRNEKIPFGILDEDRRRHLYVIGKTGVGKSRFLELLMMNDIQQEKGFCLLDPHGDLAEAVVKRVPKNRIKDVVYVDPSDRDFPIGFNPLEYTDNYEKRQHIAYFFIAIFKKLFASDWNERMEHILRNIVLALLETQDSNVLGINRIITDTQYRHRVINQLHDPVVKQFWANEFSSWNEQYSSQAIVPILNKVGQFISNPIIRNMVGQQKNMLDFTSFMNEGKIVILNISKGKLGEDNAALLGSMFITKIQQAALSRANISEEERKDFYFYIDEFQNFATDAFQSILSESRKYRLNLTIAHQYIDQL